MVNFCPLSQGCKLREQHASHQAPAPSYGPGRGALKQGERGAQRGQEAGRGELGNGETNSIFCSAVEGGLPWPTGSPSKAISDRVECLVFPGAEAAKPRKPSVSLPLISCFEKCSVRR